MLVNASVSTRSPTGLNRPRAKDAFLWTWSIFFEQDKFSCTYKTNVLALLTWHIGRPSMLMLILFSIKLSFYRLVVISINSVFVTFSVSLLANSRQLFTSFSSLLTCSSMIAVLFAATVKLESLAYIDEVAEDKQFGRSLRSNAFDRSR